MPCQTDGLGLKAAAREFACPAATIWPGPRSRTVTRLDASDRHPIHGPKRTSHLIAGFQRGLDLRVSRAYASLARYESSGTAILSLVTVILVAVWWICSIFERVSSLGQLGGGGGGWLQVSVQIEALGKVSRRRSAPNAGVVGPANGICIYFSSLHREQDARGLTYSGAVVGAGHVHERSASEPGSRRVVRCDHDREDNPGESSRVGPRTLKHRSEGWPNKFGVPGLLEAVHVEARC